MTRLQRRNLQLYLQFRGRRMTIIGLLWANRRIYLLLLILFAAAAGLLYALVSRSAPLYVGLAFAVAFARDIGYFRRSVMLWPVLEQVLDWQWVEQLAGSPCDAIQTKP